MSSAQREPPVACTNKGCESPATVLAAGPHGAVPYCADHSRAYAHIMGAIGFPTTMVPIGTPAIVVNGNDE